MSSFTENLIVEVFKNNKFKNHSEFSFYYYINNKKETINIPVGFVTNFASVPRLFWPFVGPIDNHAKAAIVHDYCYANIYKNDRKLSDKLFLLGMKILKVNIVKRYLMYFAVRLFGWAVWSKYKNLKD